MNAPISLHRSCSARVGQRRTRSNGAGIRAIVVAGLLRVLVATAGEAEVYLTKEAALRAVFGSGCEPSYEPREVAPDLESRFRTAGVSAPEEGGKVHLFACRREGRTLGYGIIGAQVGKHLPITYIVGIAPDGRVHRVEMMVFREVRGWEARERRFMAQFEGKSVDENLRVGSGIRNVTGATLSSNAISRGVLRSLIAWNYFIRDGGA